MSTEYIRHTPTDEPVIAQEPRNLYLVVNIKSHYFGTTIEEIDREYINEQDSIALWIKDSITGLWFRCTELEQTFEGSMDEENMETLQNLMVEESRVKYNPRDPNNEGDGIPDI